jgi:DNA-binding transcriptional MerR regulator
MEHMRRKPTVDDYVVSFAEYEKKQKREFTSEDKKRYLEALKRGGRNNGFTTEVIAEILMGEADQILKEHGV